MLGHLTAVLDLSLLSSPIPKASQNLALHLVRATARRIELANLMAQTRHQWVLRFARSPEFVDVDPEAAIALDHNGRIAGMTHIGAQVLSRAIEQDWRNSADLIGRPVTDFFDLGLDVLPELTRQRATQERLVRMRDGHALFAHAIEPKPVRSSMVRGASIPASIGNLGEGADMAALQLKTTKLARTTLPILIQGETGSGKEHLARAVHDASGRKGAFIAINCAAIPEQLIESELFGYTPGAFTGAAVKGRKGLIEQADGGTLFLDEIGDMALPLQSRLLRVLAEGEVQPVGALVPRKVDLRVVSASHRSLASLVEQGRFREDLYYRLNAAALRLPLTRTQRFRLDSRSSAGTAWQGTFAGDDGHGKSRTSRPSLAGQHPRVGQCDCPRSGAERQRHYRLRRSARLSGPLRCCGDDEAAALRAALVACNWNVSEAARRLEVDRTTIHRRIKRLGIAPHN
jgi:transcriptional regulator of acetoin/glycerol metabolism